MARHVDSAALVSPVALLLRWNGRVQKFPNKGGVSVLVNTAN